MEMPLASPIAHLKLVNQDRDRVKLVILILRIHTRRNWVSRGSKKSVGRGSDVVGWMRRGYYFPTVSFESSQGRVEHRRYLEALDNQSKVVNCRLWRFSLHASRSTRELQLHVGTHLASKPDREEMEKGIELGKGEITFTVTLGQPIRMRSKKVGVSQKPSFSCHNRNIALYEP